jgi:tetratricopeptide (TPR) repeat protein
VDLSQDLPSEEKDLILATHAQIIDDVDKAIESYERLVQARPANGQLHFQLGTLFESKGNFPRARDEYARTLETDPKYVEALLAAGRVEIRSGNYQGSIDYLTRALTFSIQLGRREEQARVQQALGIAYKRLGKLDEALAQYNDSLRIKREVNDQRGIAVSLGEIGQVYDLQGRPDEAEKYYKESLDTHRKIGDKRGVGLMLNSLGASYLDQSKYDDALAVLKEALPIQRDLGDENEQARCLTNIGSVYFGKGQYEDAQTYLGRALELREKLKVPGNIAFTLASLAEVSARLGDDDLAEKQYRRAIELWRGAEDKRGAAFGAYGLANLSEDRGRYGAAVEAKAEALKTFRELQERSYVLAEVMSSYGHALGLVGRSDEATKQLQEALGLARNVQNTTVVAQTLNFLGEVAYYKGDMKAARSYFEQAQNAARTADRFVQLRAQLNLAKLAVEEPRPQAAVAELRRLVKETDDLGLKYLSAESTTYLAAALLKTGDAAQARAVLESALTRMERLAARPLLARSSYLLGEALRASGQERNAATHYRRAVQLVDEMQKESPGGKLLDRYDLKVIYEQSNLWLQNAPK